MKLNDAALKATQTVRGFRKCRRPLELNLCKGSASNLVLQQDVILFGLSAIPLRLRLVQIHVGGCLIAFLRQTPSFWNI